MANGTGVDPREARIRDLERQLKTALEEKALLEKRLRVTELRAESAEKIAGLR